MAKFDSSDLLSRVKFHAMRPSTDASMTDAQWYTLLSDAQDIWTRRIAAIAPEQLVGAPVQLTTSDNKVWTFSDYPIGHLEIRHGKGGELMTLGADYLDSTDLVWEGSQVRIPSDRTRTFSNGLWARYIAEPSVIDASTEPTLKPDQARILLVYQAVADWATRGDLRNPGVWLGLLDQAWESLHTTFATQAHGLGLDAGVGVTTAWYNSVDLTN